MTTLSSRSVRLALGVAAAAIVAAVLLTVALSSSAQDLSPTEPEPSPQAPSEDLAAAKVELSDVRTKERLSLESYKGQTVLVVFCASWIPECRDVFSSAEVVAARQANVQVVGVSLDNPEFGSDDVAAFANDAGFQFPFLRDGGRRLARSLNVTRLPATYVIGTDGALTGSIAGAPEDYEARLSLDVAASVTDSRDAP